MDIRYRQPFALRAQTWTFRSSTCICSSGVVTGASPAISTVDARAVAQSLHTRIPQAITLLVFSGMRVSLSCYNVWSGEKTRRQLPPLCHFSSLSVRSCIHGSTSLSFCGHYRILSVINAHRTMYALIS